MMLNGYMLEKYLKLNENERSEICKAKLLNQDILESAVISRN
jgi:hypothetical protein